MYIQAYCPANAQPKSGIVKGLINNFIDIAVVLSLHALAAYILGINPTLGLALGGFAMLLHRFLQLGNLCGGACGGGLVGALIGTPIGACAKDAASGAFKGAVVGAVVTSALAVLGTIFLTYYIGMQICNSIPSLQTTISYSQALAIMGVALGLEAVVGSINTTAILSRAAAHKGIDDLKQAISNHPVYGLALAAIEKTNEAGGSNDG